MTRTRYGFKDDEAVCRSLDRRPAGLQAALMLLADGEPSAGISAGQSLTSPSSRAAEILSAAVDFYSGVLWRRDQASVTRSFLRRHGLDRDTLLQFRVGYAPIGWTTLLDHLGGRGYGPAEVVAAGLATRSHRRGDRFYDHFRSRLMFPIARPGGPVVGFAGRGTHPGPSWPRYVISPNTEAFVGRKAIFGLDHAAQTIRTTGEAWVLRDCLDVLDRHQHGAKNHVAIIRSPITADHRVELDRYANSIHRAQPRREGRAPAG